MTYEITEPAERDIKDILTRTLKVFGTHQLAVYGEIIDKAFAMVGDDPDRAGSIDRSEIGGAASHCLYCMTGRMSDGVVGTIILRVLSEKMEPRYRVARKP